MAQRSGKGAKQCSFKADKQPKLLDYLDEMINGYYQKNNTYPTRIIMNKETKDKIFIELGLEPEIDNSWKDSKDNYRGIEIEIKKDIAFIELGE
jgi:hypothetical protein